MRETHPDVHILLLILVVQLVSIYHSTTSRSPLQISKDSDNCFLIFYGMITCVSRKVANSKCDIWSSTIGYIRQTVIQLACCNCETCLLVLSDNLHDLS